MNRPLVAGGAVPGHEPQGREDALSSSWIPVCAFGWPRVAPRPATPLLCVHGWGRVAVHVPPRASKMLSQARPFRVVALDLRGAGLSDKPSTRGAYSAEAFRADPCVARRATRLHASVGPGGNRWGGGIALDFALARPEAGGARLVLINPTGAYAPLPFIVPFASRSAVVLCAWRGASWFRGGW